jgi:hypothetical protein
LSDPQLAFARCANKVMACFTRWPPSSLGVLSPLPGESKRAVFMTEADHTDTYEQRAQAIQFASQPILDGFERWLKHAGWSEQTVHDHVDNIGFFTKYLAWYTRSQHRLDEATDGDVYWFLADWFPRKALWASVASVRGGLCSPRAVLLACLQIVLRCLLAYERWG